MLYRLGRSSRRYLGRVIIRRSRVSVSLLIKASAIEKRAFHNTTSATPTSPPPHPFLFRRMLDDAPNTNAYLNLGDATL